MYRNKGPTFSISPCMNPVGQEGGNKSPQYFHKTRLNCRHGNRTNSHWRLTRHVYTQRVKKFSMASVIRLQYVAEMNLRPVIHGTDGDHVSTSLIGVRNDGTILRGTLSGLSVLLDFNADFRIVCHRPNRNDFWQFYELCKANNIRDWRRVRGNINGTHNSTAITKWTALAYGLPCHLVYLV